jgi:hypothetical protein
MRYHLRSAESEWTIEPSDVSTWVLKERTEEEWRELGTYSTPTEAAVKVGANAAKSPDLRDRRGQMRHYVLSCWDTY